MHQCIDWNLGLAGSFKGFEFSGVAHFNCMQCPQCLNSGTHAAQNQIEVKTCFRCDLPCFRASTRFYLSLTGIANRPESCRCLLPRGTGSSPSSPAADRGGAWGLRLPGFELMRRRPTSAHPRALSETSSHIASQPLFSVDNLSI